MVNKIEDTISNDTTILHYILETCFSLCVANYRCPITAIIGSPAEW